MIEKTFDRINGIKTDIFKKTFHYREPEIQRKIQITRTKSQKKFIARKGAEVQRDKEKRKNRKKFNRR